MTSSPFGYFTAAGSSPVSSEQSSVTIAQATQFQGLKPGNVFGGSTSSVSMGSTSAGIFGGSASGDSGDSVFGSKTFAEPTSTSPSALFGGKVASVMQTSVLSAATSSVPIFGGTSPVFGASALSSQPVLPQTSAFGGFGASDSVKEGSLFGKPASDSVKEGSLFGKPASDSVKEGSLFGKPASNSAKEGSLFGKATSDSAKEGSLFGKPASDSAKEGSLFGKPASDSAKEGSLFGKPASDSAKEKEGSLFWKATSDSVKEGSLFGKPASDSAKEGSLFGKPASDSVKEGSLFGKPASDSVKEGSVFGARPGLYGRTSDSVDDRDKDQSGSRGLKPGLFGKSSVSPERETPRSEQGTKFSQKPAAGLFGKQSAGTFVEKESERGVVLFGRSSHPASEGGEGSERQEKRNVFGGHQVVQVDKRSLFGKTSTSPEADRKRERRIERPPLSRRQSETLHRPARGLFGKAVPEAKMEETGRQPKMLFGKRLSKEASEDEGGTRRVRPSISGQIKQSSMLSDAARRSVKKSISIARSKSRDVSDEFSTKTAIVCQDVPNEFNNRTFLLRHFSKFGHVKRVYPNPAKARATIHFNTHEEALNAKKKGKRFRVGMPNVSIYFSQYSPGGAGKEEKEKPPVQTLFGKVVSNQGPSRNLFPEIHDELGALRGTSDHSIMENVRLVQHVQRPEEHEDHDRPRPIETVMSSRSPVKVRQDSGLASSIRTLPLERQASPLRGAGRFQSGAVHNVAERINILEERDKQVRQRVQRVSRLEAAQAVIGTCPDMCPEKERYLREDQRRLSIFEMVSGTNIRGQNPKVDHTKAVKEYSRSSADQEEPLPHELRPPPVLAKTMDYLVNNIMDLGSTNWAEWYDFVWNRTRGIRKDITQQHLCDLTAVDLVEKCVRFHIYCAERLVEQDMMVFDAKINTENLTKCLQTLKELYYDLERKTNIRCPNEAEFRSYMILMNLNEGDTLRQVQQLPDDIRASPAVKFALETYHAIDSNNYIRYFKLVKKATFLQACIMHRYFNQVRRKALRIMLKALHKRTQYPVDDLIRQLAFEDEEDARDFCEDHGLDVVDRTVMLNKSDYITPDAIVTLRRAEKLIESKLDVSVGEIVHGGPLPPNSIITPSSSFDGNSGYIPDVPVQVSQEAEDQAVVCQPGEVAGVSTAERTSDDARDSPRRISSDVIKELAKELFLEVIDEVALQTSKDMMHEVEIGTTCKQVADETCWELAREISQQMIEEALKEKEEEERRQRLLEEERRRKEEEERRQALILEACQQVVQDVEGEVVKEMVLKVAREEYSLVQSQLQKESQQRMTVVVGDEIMEDVCNFLVEGIAEEVHDLEVRKQELSDIKCTVELFRVNHFFKIWWKRYIKRIRLKMAMQKFPSAPSQNCLDEQVNSILPCRPTGEISDDAFYVGKVGRVSIDVPQMISLRQKVNMSHIDLRHLLAQLQHDRAWKPLDLPSLVGERLVERLLDGVSRRELMISGHSLYWKVLVVQPDGQKSISCDWVKHKLQRGTATNARNYRKGRVDGFDLLSLYSSSLVDPSGPFETSLHVCVSATTMKQLEKDHVVGTSVTIGFLSSCQTHQENLQSLQYLLSKFPSVPLLIVIDGDLDETEQDSFMAMGQGRLNLISIQDVERFEATKLLGQGLQWAAESCPHPPNLERTALRNYIDEFLFKEFYTPVYENLAARKKKGLPHQSPNILIGLYQAAVSHLANVAGNLGLAKISWPALEFSCTNPDLPPQEWNSRDQLDFLEELLFSISLPSFIYHDREAESWSKACRDVWAYVEALIHKGSDTTNLYSRIGWAIRKSREQFEDTCYLAERLEDCKPSYINMPWTEIISACISYKIANLDWIDGMAEYDDDPSEIMVYYLPSSLKSYSQPSLWSEALSAEVEIGTTTTKDSIVRAAKRKLDETRNDSLTKRTAVDAVSPNTSTILDLANTSQVQLEADQTSHELKSQLAIEKEKLDRFEKYLEGALTEVNDVPIDMDATWAGSFQNVGDKSDDGIDVDQSASDSMLVLQRSVHSHKQADKNFEMRLQSLLMTK